MPTNVQRPLAHRRRLCAAKGLCCDAVNPNSFSRPSASLLGKNHPTLQSHLRSRWVYIEAADQNHVLLSVDDLKMTVFVHRSQISCKISPSKLERSLSCARLSIQPAPFAHFPVYVLQYLSTLGTLHEVGRCIPLLRKLRLCVRAGRPAVSRVRTFVLARSQIRGQFWPKRGRCG
jgi:hypothetical protein